jgi:hypothetical protein
MQIETGTERERERQRDRETDRETGIRGFVALSQPSRAYQKNQKSSGLRRALTARLAVTQTWTEFLSVLIYARGTCDQEDV